MRTLREIIGLPVLLEGQLTGYVLGADTDEALTKVCGLWISGVHTGSRRIEAEDIVSIGDRSVLVKSRGKRASARSGMLFRRAVTTDGTRIGAVIDCDVSDSLDISALWLTCGYPDDLLRGRQRIERYAVRSSDGTVLIPSGREDEP